MQSLTENCSHEIKRYFLLGRKAMANLGRILKSRDITLPIKVHIVKDMVLPVVIYGCESWTINKAEHQRCFQNVVLENTFESLLHSKIKSVHPKGNQPWLFIGRTDTEAEAPIPWPPGVKSQLIEKILMLGETEGGRRGGDRGWDGWMASSAQRTWVWANRGGFWRTGNPNMLQSMGSQRGRHSLALNSNK